MVAIKQAFNPGFYLINSIWTLTVCNGPRRPDNVDDIS